MRDAAAPTTAPKVFGPKQFRFDYATFRWSGVEPQAYKFSLGDVRGMGWRGVMRFTLAGPPVWPVTFELRYFELAPGGYSSFEKHTHAHCIVALRGRGRAVVGHEVFALNPFDIVHVPPRTPHRWFNEGDEPFGFLCPVNASRDAPQPLSEEEWVALRHNPATAPYVF
jgi:quercetin dioxygenase-like cupin family protein